MKNGEEDSIQVYKIKNDWGKCGKLKRKKNTTQSNTTWKKKLIFFDLSYWKVIIVTFSSFLFIISNCV